MAPTTSASTEAHENFEGDQPWSVHRPGPDRPIWVKDGLESPSSVAANLGKLKKLRFPPFYPEEMPVLESIYLAKL